MNARSVLYQGKLVLWFYGDELPTLVLEQLYNDYPKALEKAGKKILPISESEFYEKMFCASKRFPNLFINYHAESETDQPNLEAGINTLVASQILKFSDSTTILTPAISIRSTQIRETLQLQEAELNSIVELGKYIMPKEAFGDLIDI